jgi:nucleoside-diphosphate-sugar epimerase
MRVFVSGATGVIGRRVVPALLAEGHQVTAAVHTRPRAHPLEAIGARVRELSLFEPDQLRAAVSGHDAIVNMATHVPHSGWGTFLPGAWHETDHIRREGVANLVAAAEATGVRILIQESFAPIYADHGDAWIDEEAPLRPGRYNRSILDAEAAVHHFGGQGGTGIILRFGDFYGEDASQLADMITAVRHGWLPLPGDERSFISSCSHDDAAAAVVAALRVSAGAYNVVDDHPLRHRDFGDALADALGVRHPHLLPRWTAWLGGSVGRTLARSLRVSNQKLRYASGWAPRYRSVREGFPEVVRKMSPAWRLGAGSKHAVEHRF